MAWHGRKALAVAGAVVAALFARCGQGDAAGPAPESDVEVPSVRVAVAAARPMERSITAAGTLAPREESILGAKVAGRVQHVAVDVGSSVRRGDLLVQIERHDYELRERQARATLAQARAALGLPSDGEDDAVDVESVAAVREARALLDQATRNRDRASELAASGILSRSEQDAVEAEFAVAATRHDRALEDARTRLAAVAQRRAEYEIARKQLADTAVLAPFHGIVRERRANLGEYVSAGAPLVILVGADPLRLRLEVPERDALLVRIGQAVRLRVEGDAREYEGAIARVSPSLDDESRTLRVEADIPASGALRPGLFARARVVIDGAEPALSVPADALVTFAGIEKVIVVEDGKARETTVTTGRRDGSRIEIVAGLDEGATVIRSPGTIHGGQTVAVSGGSASDDIAAPAGTTTPGR